MAGSLRTYIAFNCGLDLVLYACCLSQQTFVDGQSPHPLGARFSRIVDFCSSITFSSREDIAIVPPYIVTLCLYCRVPVSMLLLLAVSTPYHSSPLEGQIIIPSVIVFVANMVRGEEDMYLSVASLSPSLIMRCTTTSALNAMVHVESLNRCCRVRKISATPASPERVPRRMCSTYFDLGGANCAAKSACGFSTRVA